MRIFEWSWRVLRWHVLWFREVRHRKISGWWWAEGGYKTHFTSDRHNVADDVGVNLGQDRAAASCRFVMPSISDATAARSKAAVGIFFKGMTLPSHGRSHRREGARLSPDHDL